MIVPVSIYCPAHDLEPGVACPVPGGACRDRIIAARTEDARAGHPSPELCFTGECEDCRRARGTERMVGMFRSMSGASLEVEQRLAAEERTGATDDAPAWSGVIDERKQRGEA